MLISRLSSPRSSSRRLLLTTALLHQRICWASSSSSSSSSSLQGPPIWAPAQDDCQIIEKFDAPLLEHIPVSDTSSILRFGLPDRSRPLNLPTCACILASAKIGDSGEDVIRPYTPISTNADIGHVDLLVKNYGPKHGLMSYHLHSLSPGEDTITLFHNPEKNVKISADETLMSGKYDHIVMLTGGTGITPMIQALHAILGSESSKNKVKKVTMLYGSKVANDILGKELLDKWAQDHKDQLELVYVISEADDDWTGRRGFVDKALVEEYVSENEDRVIFLVCGPPPMYDALCGPREESDTVSGALAELGYAAKDVYKF